MVENVMTFKEATERWKLGESTLRSTIRTDKLIENVDYWKSGSTWLIKEDAMIKVYGYTQEMKKINTKMLAEKFKLIRNKKSKENDFLFKQINFGIQYSNKDIFTEEDIIGICVMSVLKKCSWLNLENYEHFKNVNDFIILFFKEMKKNATIKSDEKEFYKLASIIINLSE